MPRPKFSVIIPTYNRAAFIPEALASVLGQSYAPDEVIVIDDGSTDNTAAVLKHYGGRVTCIVQANAGPSAARNEGIRQSRNEWISFLDSDDAWEPTYLEKQAARIERYPDAVAHITNAVLLHPDGRKENLQDIYGMSPSFGGTDILLLERPLKHVVKHTLTFLQTTAARRSALIQAGLFPLKIRVREDLHLIARVAMSGSFSVTNEPLVRLYRRVEPITNLSMLAKLKGIQTQTDFVGILSGIRDLEGLNRAELILVTTELSDNQRSLGNLYMRSGQYAEGRRWFREAVKTQVSVRSVAKAILSLTPRPIWSLFDRQGTDVAP